MGERVFAQKRANGKHHHPVLSGRVNLAEQIVDVVMKWEERNAEGLLVAKKEGAFNLRYLSALS